MREIGANDVGAKVLAAPTSAKSVGGGREIAPLVENCCGTSSVAIEAISSSAS